MLVTGQFRKLRWSRIFKGVVVGQLLVSVALAQQVVVSDKPDAIAVTVYNDDLALIRETRTITLPPGADGDGPISLQFRGVSDGMIAVSAIIEGLPDSVVERNYDYNLLTPYSLVTRSIGKGVTLVRRNPGTGVETRRRAIIRAAGNGTILEFENGETEALKCSGLPEGLVFDEIPTDLNSDPTLSVKVAPGAGGQYTVTLSYLAMGVTWAADYVATVSPMGDKIALTGWITIKNQNDGGFADAETAVISGDLNRLFEDDNIGYGFRSLISNCWMIGRRWPHAEEIIPGAYDVAAPAPPAPTAAMAQDIIVTAMKRSEAAAVQEEFFDYKLYRVPWPTTVAAQQTKQVRFLDKAAIKTERRYQFIIPDPDSWSEQEDQYLNAAVLLRFMNTEKAGIGMALPGGQVVIVEDRGTDTPIRLGQDSIINKAVDLPVELVAGTTPDVQAEARIVRKDEKYLSGHRTRITSWLSHRLINYKSVPITIEVVQFENERLTIKKASQSWTRRDGRITWTVTVPAHSEKTITYQSISEY